MTLKAATKGKSTDFTIKVCALKQKFMAKFVEAS